jgi:TM2 domain-containing membrane protein YozV
MGKILNSLASPWKHGGFISGIFDMLLRIIALFAWCSLTWLIIQFVYDAIFVEIIWAKKFWWLGYSFLLFTTTTVLAYTAIWDRR